MFQAGAVAPSSALLLQELYEPDPLVGVSGLSLALLIARPFRVYEPVPDEPVAFGLMTPRLLWGPTVRGNLPGARAFALRLNAAKHWRTCVEIDCQEDIVGR